MKPEDKSQYSDNSHNEGELRSRCKSALEYSIEHYDDNTLNQLAEARRKALDEIPTSAEGAISWWRFRPWLLGGGVVASGLLLALVLVTSATQENTPSKDTPEALLTIILELEELEMHQQDVEFYEWLVADGLI